MFSFAIEVCGNENKTPPYPNYGKLSRALDYSRWGTKDSCGIMEWNEWILLFAVIRDPGPPDFRPKIDGKKVVTESKLIIFFASIL